MQIEATMRYHFITTKIGCNLKKKKKTSVGEDVQKLGMLYIAKGNVTC